MTRIHLGISTCPNDTFAFHGILTKQVPLRGLDIHIELLDVETLNQRLFVGDFDVAKASFHAALLLANELKVLPVGSALGFGVGPLLLAAKTGTHPRDPVEMSHRSRPAWVLASTPQQRFSTNYSIQAKDSYSKPFFRTSCRRSKPLSQILACAFTKAVSLGRSMD